MKEKTENNIKDEIYIVKSLISRYDYKAIQFDLIIENDNELTVLAYLDDEKEFKIHVFEMGSTSEYYKNNFINSLNEKELNKTIKKITDRLKKEKWAIVYLNRNNNT